MNFKSNFDESPPDYTLYSEKPFKTLFHLYKGNYLKLILATLLFLIKITPVWVAPIATTNIINALVAKDPQQFPIILHNVLFVLLTIAINIPSNLFCNKFLSQSIRSVEANIRLNLVKKLQILSIPYHKHLKSGKLQSKILRDVEVISLFSTQFFNCIIPIILNLIIIFSITISKNKWVALFFAISIPICFFFITAFSLKITTSTRSLRKNIEEMSATVAQMVEMIPITRAHALEDVEIKKVHETVEGVQQTGYKVDVLNAFFGSCIWATFQCLQVACLLFTGYLAFKGEIEVGDIFLYQGYFGILLNQVSMAINIYPELVKGIESIRSVGEIFLATDVEKHKGKKRLKTVSGNYEFKDITFKYEDSDTPVLNHFNLSVKEGECIAFVGESGGGKSTLLNLLIGFMYPTYGKLLLDGEDLSTLDLSSYREQIAVVPQNTLLFSGTIRENITYGLLKVDENKLKEVVEAAALKEVVEKLPNGLDTIVGEHGDMLSGGQKQRIAIARALMREPKIIILDEATSALDNQSEVHIQKAMKNLVKGRTTFIVAHRLSTIIDADQIIVVKDGQNVEQGTYDELVHKQSYFYDLLAHN